MHRLRSEIVALALEQVGKPYAEHGWGPKAFDCIGLCGYCWKQTGVVDYDLAQEADHEIRAYTSRSQPVLMRFGLEKYLTKVRKEDVLVGDALWFRYPKEQHLGIVTKVRDGVFYVVHAQFARKLVRHQRVRKSGFVICGWRPPGLIDG